MEKLRKNYENAKESSDYGNGRFVRKMLEEAEMNLAERVSRVAESELTVQVLTTIKEGDILEPETKKTDKKKTMGFCA